MLQENFHYNSRGSNEIEIFGRIVAFLVSYASEFQGGSFDTPYDILIRDSMKKYWSLNPP